MNRQGQTNSNIEEQCCDNLHGVFIQNCTVRGRVHWFIYPPSVTPTADSCCSPVSSATSPVYGESVFEVFHADTRGRYHGGRRPSSDDSLHSPTVIAPSALDKPSIMKRYHRRRTGSHTSPRRSPTMVTLPDTRFVECRWWSDGCTVKTVVS